jgi:hypothetical protein
MRRREVTLSPTLLARAEVIDINDSGEIVGRMQGDVPDPPGR